MLLRFILTSFCLSFTVFADDWQQIAEDLQTRRVSVSDGNLLTPELFFVKTNLQKYQPIVVRAKDHGLQRATINVLAKKTSAILGINANFFDENGEALGVVINQGILRNKLHRGGDTLTGVFYFTREGIGIVNRSDFVLGSAIEAVQAGPRLIENKKLIKISESLDTATRRAGVCIDSNHALIFYITSGLFGITLRDLQQVLLDIDCQQALNLDGGGSAQFYLSSDLPDKTLGKQDLIIAGRDPVPVMLGLFVK